VQGFGQYVARCAQEGLMDKKQPAFRPATSADSALAYEIKKAALGPYIVQVFGWDEARQIDFHAEEFHPTNSHILLDHDRPIGWFAAHQEDAAFFIDHLYLLPDVHGQGIGTQVLQMLLQTADAAGLVACLDVLKVNPARRLYERCGFSITGANADFFHMERQPRQP
jgi:GNAT superfamily N-acetyltransferase